MTPLLRLVAPAAVVLGLLTSCAANDGELDSRTATGATSAKAAQVGRVAVAEIDPATGDETAPSVTAPTTTVTNPPFVDPIVVLPDDQLVGILDAEALTVWGHETSYEQAHAFIQDMRAIEREQRRKARAGLEYFQPNATVGAKYFIDENTIYSYTAPPSYEYTPPPSYTYESPSYQYTPPPSYTYESPSYPPGGFNDQGCPRDQYVNGYYRSNGTYVEGYYRNSPHDGCGGG